MPCKSSSRHVQIHWCPQGGIYAEFKSTEGLRLYVQTHSRIVACFERQQLGVVVQDREGAAKTQRKVAHSLLQAHKTGGQRPHGIIFGVMAGPVG